MNVPSGTSRDAGINREVKIAWEMKSVARTQADKERNFISTFEPRDRGNVHLMDSREYVFNFHFFEESNFRPKRRCSFWTRFQSAKSWSAKWVKVWTSRRAVWLCIRSKSLSRDRQYGKKRVNLGHHNLQPYHYLFWTIIVFLSFQLMLLTFRYFNSTSFQSESVNAKPWFTRYCCCFSFVGLICLLFLFGIPLLSQKFIA